MALLIENILERLRERADPEEDFYWGITILDEDEDEDEGEEAFDSLLAKGNIENALLSFSEFFTSVAPFGVLGWVMTKEELTNLNPISFAYDQVLSSLDEGEDISIDDFIDEMISFIILPDNMIHLRPMTLIDWRDTYFV